MVCKSYWLTTALALPRVKVARPPSTCVLPPLPLVTGKLPRAAIEFNSYCGVCMTIEYEMPLAGFSQ